MATNSVIVLIEDEEAHRELIKRAFEHSDEHVVLVECSTLQEAERFFSEQYNSDNTNIEIIISDWNLPDGHGMDLLRRTRIEAPFLLMTSFGNEALAVEAIKAGAIDYIVKSPNEFRRMPATAQRIRREWINIRERKRAENALRQREEQLRAIINNTDEPIWSIDQNYNILAFNAAFQSIMHIMLNHIPSIGDNILDFLPDTGHNSRHLWKNYYDTVIAEGKQLIIELDENIAGRKVHAELSLHPIISLSNSITGVVIFSRDVTERKRIEQERQERQERLNIALQEKSRLLEALETEKHKTLQALIEGQEHERSRIAKDLHDGVGQMLSVIKIGLSSVQEQLSSYSPAEAEQLCKTIRLLDKTVQEVRAVSHELMPVALQQLGLRAAIQDICSAITANTDIRIHTELSAFQQRLDAVQELTLYRIIQELLNNTLKYGNAQRISIQALREESSLLVMYEDDGQGFELAADTRGIGLGNIISRTLMLGGTAELQSKPGEGMAATIDIPLRQ